MLRLAGKASIRRRPVNSTLDRTTPNPMRFEGTLTSWDDARGFGFIESEQGGEPIFAHARAFQASAGRPTAGMRVSFEIELGPKGKRAKSVRVVRQRTAARRPSVEAPARWGPLSIVAVPVLIAVYYATARTWPVSYLWAVAYCVMSILTFLAYTFDKAAAVRKTWRTSEQTLLTLGFLCGWPGALIAQQVLRHKSSKAPFRFAFWLTVAANLAAFVALNSPFAKRILERGAV